MARKLSWLVVASMTTVALVAPGAVANAASVAPIYTGGTLGSNPTCADIGAAYGGGQTWLELEKIDGMPANGTYGEITIYGVSGQTFSWSSTVPVDAVLVKAGADNHAAYVYAPTAGSAESMGDTNLTHGPNQQGTSHVSFCYDTSNPSPTPTPTPVVTPTPTPVVTPTPEITPTPTPVVTPTPEITPTPTPEVTPTPTPEITPTPTPVVTPTPEVTPTPTPVVTPTPTPVVTPTPTATPSGDVGGETGTPAPSGDVDGATGTPGVTLPPTDTIGAAGTANTGESWRLIVLAMAGLLAAALLLTPAKAEARTGRRR